MQRFHAMKITRTVLVESPLRFAFSQRLLSFLLISLGFLISVSFKHWSKKIPTPPGLINVDGKLWKGQRKFLHGQLRNFGMKMGAGKEQLESRIMVSGHSIFIFLRCWFRFSCMQSKSGWKLISQFNNAMGSIFWNRLRWTNFLTAF